VSGCEAGVFPLLFGDLRRHPEAVNADRDHDEQEPLDPQAKKAYPGASEHQLSALNERVLRPPLLHEDKLASRLPTDSLHLQDPNNPACLTSFRHAVSSSTRHCARRRITRRTSSGHKKWAGQPLTSCRDPFSEQVPGDCPNFPSVREGGLELFRSPSPAESRIGILARKQGDVGGSTGGQLHRDTRTYTTLST